MKRCLTIWTLILALLVTALPLAALAEADTPSVLTMARLNELRDAGKVEYTLNDQGYVTWLYGDYYDGKITNIQSVLVALETLRDVLGMSEDTAFVKGSAIEDDNGYFYFTVRQFSAGNAVYGAIVKLIADADGNAIALSSSVKPGIGADYEDIITAEQAVEIAKKYLSEHDPDTEYTFYADRVGKTMLTRDQGFLSAVYIVYTDNPDVSAVTNDMAYIAHYVGSDGNFVYSVPVSAIDDEFAQSGGNAETHFLDREQTTYTGDVTLHDGSVKNITVPVLYDADEGKYYLADATRKIAVMDDFALEYENRVDIRTTPDNTGWNDIDLITYWNYINAYDYYAAVGWYSVDGLGSPIAILVDSRDPSGAQTDSASFAGRISGWQSFTGSYINHYGECLDVTVHEYTHGFTCTAMTTIAYMGEYGAINEAFSDIMGNIAEMLTGATTDTEWLVGEMGGEALRSMTNPNDYWQPAYIGDMYSVPLDGELNAFNDNGGVHFNNMLLGNIALDLSDNGMTLEEQRTLWTSAACALTPFSGFKELNAIMRFACDISGLGEWKDTIDEAFSRIGVFEAIKPADWQPLPGCAIARVSVEQSERYKAARLMLLDPETGAPAFKWITWPDADGTVTIHVPAGQYVLGAITTDAEKPGEAPRMIYTLDGWQFGVEPKDGAAVTFEDGKAFTLPDITW